MGERDEGKSGEMLQKQKHQGVDDRDISKLFLTVRSENVLLFIAFGVFE